MTEQHQETGEVHQASGAALRDLVLVFTQVAEIMAMRRMRIAQETQFASQQDVDQSTRRLRAEYAAAQPIMQQVWEPSWWQKADAETIGQAWGITAGWARAGDAEAARALEYMRQQLEQRGAMAAPPAAPRRPNPQTGAEQLGALLASQAGRWDAVSLLRENIRPEWWHEADPDGIAFVWDTVRAWPEGPQRNAARAHLRQTLREAYGRTMHFGATGSTVAEVVNRARDAGDPGRADILARAHDEEAASRAAGETAEGLAGTGGPRADIRAEVGHGHDMGAAAGYDYELAGIVAGADDDQVAADVIRRAGVGRRDTPAAQRQATSQHRAAAPRHPATGPRRMTRAPGHPQQPQLPYDRGGDR